MKLLLALALAVGAVQAGTLYSVLSLGGYGGASSSATGISSNGHTAGSAVNAWGVDVAFEDGHVLGTAMQASDVNSSGTVVGTSVKSGFARATVWSGGVANEVLGVESYGLAINDSGQIAGSRLSGGQMRAYVGTGNTFQDLPVSGSWSAAYDINSGGEVTGYAMQWDGSMKAFIWDAVSGTHMLSTLGGRSSYAQALNDSGAVVGASLTRLGALHAFIYDGTMRDLGTLGGMLSSAYDINGSGQVVGYSYDSFGRSRAFVWSNGVMVDLNSLVEPGVGWTFTEAYGINDAGQIVGQGLHNGVVTAFLLDPYASQPASAFARADASVPEPAWLGAVGVVFLLLGSRRLRRQSTGNGDE